MMNPNSCYLDVNNSMPIGELTVAELIRKQGKMHLWEERTSSVIDTVVIHHISAVVDFPDDLYNSAHIMQLFCTYGVSSHYLIDRRGDICILVPEQLKAWHCGPSIMPPPDSRRGVNDFSIGIELMGTEQSGYTDAQYDSLVALCKDIESRRGPMKYVGHEDVAGEAAVLLGLRAVAKTDPGPLFDWERFERERMG